MPSGMAMTIEMIRPNSVSSADAGSRLDDLGHHRLAGRERIAEIAVGEIVRRNRRNCSGSGLSRPSDLRMSAIDSGVAAGPAKYTAGSPGSTRVSRNVTMMTPISVGITVT